MKKILALTLVMILSLTGGIMANAGKADYTYIESAYTDIYNTDYNGNVLNGGKTALYRSNVRYIAPVCHVNINSGKTQKAKFYYKLIGPTGKVIRSSSSPKGYTNSATFKLKAKGSQLLNFPGWGSNTESIFDAGTYTVEVYTEKGKLIDRQTFSIYPDLTPTQLTTTQSASVTDCWAQHNVTNGGKTEGIKVHVKLEANGFKGQQMKWTLRFYNGKKEYKYSADINCMHDNALWNDQWIWVPNSVIANTFGKKKGTVINYEITLQDQNGRVVATRNNMSMKLM